MHRLSTAVAALVLAVAGVPASLAAQHAAVTRPIHDTTFANGLQVYVIEDHAIPLVTAEIVVRGGAMAQDSGQEGVPHLYEHMLFKGYGGGNGALDRELYELHGAEYNGMTSDEYVGYYLVTPSGKARDAVAILGRMVRDPEFDQDNLTRERFVVFNEFDRDMADPVYQLRLAVERRLWSTAWGRKNSLGEPDAIRAAKPATLKTIYHRYYIPNNAALFVSGDVSTADVFEAARHAFDSWRTAPDPFVADPMPPVPELSSAKAVVMTGAVQDVTVQIDWQGPSVGETPDLTYAADVFSALFNDPASRAQQHLVRSGLFENLSIDYQTAHHVGPITLVGRTTLDSLPHALEALGRELIAAASPGAFDADAIQGSRQAVRVRQALRDQSGAHAALRYADWWGIAGLDYYLTYDEHLLSVSAGDVTRYVGAYLQAPYVIGLLGPDGSTDRLKAGMRAFVSNYVPPAATK